MTIAELYMKMLKYPDNEKHNIKPEPMQSNLTEAGVEPMQTEKSGEYADYFYFTIITNMGIIIKNITRLDIKTMGIQIRELRDRTGMSQSGFAEHFGIPLSTLRKWEQGESEPAGYLVALLAKQIPSKSDSLEKIVCRDGTVFYFDSMAGTISDASGNIIPVHDNLEGVKRQNLPLYVKDMFDAYYSAVEKFNSDCRYDRKERFIWS